MADAQSVLDYINRQVRLVRMGISQVGGAILAFKIIIISVFEDPSAVGWGKVTY